MKYEEEYKKTQNVDGFVKLVLSNYDVTKATARRRFYDLRKAVKIDKENQQPSEEPSEQLVVQPTITALYPSDEKQKPTHLKMLEINDRIKYGLNQTTREELKVWGFNEYEINWLEEEGYINITTKTNKVMLEYQINLIKDIISNLTRHVDNLQKEVNKIDEVK